MKFEEAKKNYAAAVEFITDGAMVMNNSIYSAVDDFEMVSGDLDENDEIYQWFIIDWQAAERFESYTDEPIFYSNKLDMYLLGVTHFGTSWDIVPSCIVRD